VLHRNDPLTAANWVAEAYQLVGNASAAIAAKSTNRRFIDRIRRTAGIPSSPSKGDAPTDQP
jgi:hypothetical protein